MKEKWSYDSQQYLDSNGERWHFVTCNYMDHKIDYSECPFEFYFRNESRTYFGKVRFERKKDNPYKYEKFTEKVMKNLEFRVACENPETEKIWLKSWK